MNKKIRLLQNLVWIVLLAVSCRQSEQLYVKEVVFPEGATPEQKIEMASRLVPTEGQYAWQQMELTAFVHFGINTFTNREWGDGKEDPALFNPTSLDCEQWVKTLQKGGFKMIILTAKHHDGFCLWPTKTTRHSVASSPWKDGKGDVVRELKDACDKYGMKFGVYLSPWDRNAECYGDSPRYNRMFAEQLTELLTNYGTIHEIWFDGANAEGPNGRKQEYDWQLFCGVMDSLQPHAVRAIMGDDVRWVGNEQGLGRETEWSATAFMPETYPGAQVENQKLGIHAQAKDLGSRDLIAKASRLFWYPSEVDVSIRPGWFYHASQDHQVKSLQKLVDIYFESVGYNSVLLLNVPPDTRGLIHENDAARLQEFGEYLRTVFQENRLLKGEAFEMEQGDSREFQVKPGVTINTFLLGEDIRQGQRIEHFTLEAQIEGQWQSLAQGTTAGYKRLLRFPDCRPEALRLTVDQSRGRVYVREAGAYYAPVIDGQQVDFRPGDIPVTDWKIVGKVNEISAQPARQAIDNDPKTFWQTEGTESIGNLTVDMGKVYDIAGFTYMPVAGGDNAGIVFLYAFYVSEDGQKWVKCECPGEFSNIMYNPIPQTVSFGRTYPARYFRFEPLQEIKERPFVKVGEIGILKK